jgi:hypothetical protein
MYKCDKCGGISPSSDQCENHSCPNQPCCGKPKEECTCYESPLEITERNRDGLKKAYDKAVAEGADVFVYRNQQLVTGYAKYVLQYIDSILESGE